MSTIVANPHIQAGVPCIAGTRIPTRGLWCFWCAGHSISAIKAEYPSLSLERIMTAIVFEGIRRECTRLRVRPQAGPARRKEARVATTYEGR